MKKLLLSATALACLSAPVFAADLPSRKEPAAAPPPPPMWTGFHAGLNAGAIWNNATSASIETYALSPIRFLPGATSTLYGNMNLDSTVDFIGGGQIGYDLQIPFNNAGFVAGIEADIQGIAASGGNSSKLSFFPGPRSGDLGVTSFDASSSLNYLGTVRGRIGYLVTPTLLVYGTGGFAYGEANVNITNYQTFYSRIFRTNTYSAYGYGSASGMQVGYAVGGGGEWMFEPNWSIKVEYLYYDLGNADGGTANLLRLPNRSINGDPSAVQSSSTINAPFQGNIVRGGFNYHFNLGVAPVVAAF